MAAGSRNGENAMHDAARNGASAELLRLLYEASPESVKAEDRFGLPPMRHANTQPVLAFFHDVFPQALSAKNEEGETVLERFVNSQHALSTECLDFLFEKNPNLILEPLEGKEGEGNLLHRVVAAYNARGVSASTTVPISALRWMVQRSPEACITPDRDGCLPIHRFATHSDTDSIPVMELLISKRKEVESANNEENADGKEPSLSTWLVEQDPSVLLRRNTAGRTPVEELIHDPQYAYYPHHGLPVLRWLIRTCPESVNIANPATGCLPIHTAIPLDRRDMVRTLAYEAPATLMKTRLEGFLPIHDAITMDWEIGDVRHLFSLKNEVAFVPDTQERRLLLHWLLIRWSWEGTNLSFLKEVYKAFPQAACSLDKQARAPMHYAASQAQLPLELMELLIEWWPEALVAPDSDGWLPVELACQADCGLDVIFSMLQANPQQVATMCNKNG